MNLFKKLLIMCVGFFVTAEVFAAEERCFTNDRLVFTAQPELSEDGYRMISDVSVARFHDNERIAVESSDVVTFELVSNDPELFLEHPVSRVASSGVAFVGEGRMRATKMGLNVRLKATIFDEACKVAPVYSAPFNIDR